MNRNTFIKKTAIGISLLGTFPALSLQRQQVQDPQPFDVKLVKEFVSAGHKDLAKVKEMLVDYPNLIYSKYDWGNGDFEEAIEGAGHLGNKEIANYLLEQGARINLFVLTMLGKSDLVIPILNTYPQLIQSLGPHGFTLLHHAKVGEANEMITYLEDNGLKKTHVKIK